MLTMGSIICLFVLVSFSYQPLVADEPIIDKIRVINEIEKSTNKISKLNNLNIRMLKSYMESNYDCDCTYRDDPFICRVLLAIYWSIAYSIMGVGIILCLTFPNLTEIEIFEDLFNILLFGITTPIGLLYYSLDCPPTGFPPYK